MRAFRQIGLYDEYSLRHYGADYEFSRRALAAGFALYVDKASMLYVRERESGLHLSVGTRDLTALVQSLWSIKSANDLRLRWRFARRACPRRWQPAYIPCDNARVIAGSLRRHWARRGRRSTRMTGPERHYEGPAGRSYYAWQRRMGLAGGHLEARKFSSSIRPCDTVLDFGCGSGAMLLSLDCARRIGVDINPAARLEAASHGVETYPTLGEIPTSAVDVVVSNHALEHVPSPYDVICQLLRVLVPGGRLVICVPFDDWRTQRAYDSRDVNHHLYTWSPLLIGNLLCDVGFDVVSSAVLTHAWPPKWEWLDAHLPDRAFDCACGVWARIRRRRQVVVHATRPAAARALEDEPGGQQVWPR